MILLDYDAALDALYITVAGDLPEEGERRLARTDELDTGCFIDVDTEGRIIGIEVIGTDRPWPLFGILTRYQLSDEDRRMLEMLAHHRPAAATVTYPAPMGVN